MLVGRPASFRTALQHIMAVIAALLRIYIQYLAFPLWQTGAIVQYLAVGEGSGYQGRHVEGLFRLCLYQ